MGDGSCVLNCCLYWLLGVFCLDCCLAAPKRGRLRDNHALAPEPCGDCCVHCWCGPCAVCQEARLIKSHGVMPAHMAAPAGAAAPPPQYYQQAPPQGQGPPQQQFMSV
ncbi:hypothetical protein CHLNCDRAFT_140784 [Chlorella variabilis]|uniref:Uncharacterized protein n=1 Tax=Chlorella variabilis TaxID=554065 RepID=E1Z674_CHLVA|nr:hypothetical protein CHLNCDRAFT_140784 [Chlorella variabilis]EFN58599.1 hypothetical protein CHLNCDRAFT_140784 [Chlorella variabilis]|eukprot:XP_005850701.1 hypothetical protein CHLNCDRAFT_140784 [Chlorella variabilis]